MDSINVIFELLVNLFQEMMFVTFCYKFLTPSKKQITNRISYCSAVTLMFLSITLINYLYISFAYIETIVFFAIMIPYCVLFFEDRLFIKIITPLSLNVLYAVISFGLNYFFSAFINCDYNYLMTESTTYRYIYVILSNLIFVVILYLIYHLFKEQLHMMRLRNVFLSLIMPVAGIIVATLTFLVSSNASMPNSNRIILGLVSIIIICFTFMNFYLIKNISNNYALQKENLVANKEKEIYRLEIANSERYIREVSAIKHNIKNQLLCIETLIDEQNYIEAKKVCNNINDNIKITAHMYKTGNVYLDAILNIVYAKAKENKINLIVNCNTNLRFVECDDLLILIGNLVDNAIEALSTEQRKEVKIDILQKGEYAILNIQNYCRRSVLKTNPNLVTTKKDVKNHGYGLNSVKRIVKKYGGAITFYEENDYFYVNIMLEIPNIP